MSSIPEWMKLEVVRMLHEGVSEAGIKAVVDMLDGTPGITDNFWNEALHYANFVQYGRRPESHVTDEQRLLQEQK